MTVDAAATCAEKRSGPGRAQGQGPEPAPRTRPTAPGRRRHHGSAELWLGALIVSTMVAAVLLAPLLTGYDPNAQELTKRLLPPAWAEGSDPAHLLGTDQLGRDLLTRILYGGQISLAVGAGAALISGVLGTALGLVAGYFGGTAEALIMRLADIQLGLPIVLLAILMISVLGTNLVNLIFILALGGWVVYARTARGLALALREQEFVEAARSLGATDERILVRHLLPQLLRPMLVVATIQMGQMILLESSLSFLGLGVQPPTPSWGLMIAEARRYIFRAWWLSTLPGLALALLVVGLNLVGDGWPLQRRRGPG